MKALCWNGKNDIRCETVPDPKIEDVRDVIINGSDLHLMDGLMPTMKNGDILGHEFMGEVIETGSPGHKLKKGDRIVVPFNINVGNAVSAKWEITRSANDQTVTPRWRPSNLDTRRPACSAIRI